MTIQTNTKYNFDQAQDQNFSWTKWDGTSGSTLTHKATGREIYQMRWSDGKMVDGETRTLACKFWDELHALQEQKPALADVVETDPEPQHGQNGYCRKCHSYCYGDCEAN